MPFVSLKRVFYNILINILLLVDSADSPDSLLILLILLNLLFAVEITHTKSVMHHVILLLCITVVRAIIELRRGLTTGKPFRRSH